MLQFHCNIRLDEIARHQEGQNCHLFVTLRVLTIRIILICRKRQHSLRVHTTWCETFFCYFVQRSIGFVILLY